MCAIKIRKFPSKVTHICIYTRIVCDVWVKMEWEEDTRRKLESIVCRHCLFAFATFATFVPCEFFSSNKITQNFSSNTNTNNMRKHTHSLTHARTHTSKKNILKLSYKFNEWLGILFRLFYISIKKTFLRTAHFQY